MRLIATFDSEKQAYAFYSFLLKEGIHNIYESYADPKTGNRGYHLWIYDEEDFQMAIDWLDRYRTHPEDPQFQNIEISLASTPPPPRYVEIAKQEELKWQKIPSVRIQPRAYRFSLTHFIIFLCCVLFLWNDVQEEAIKRARGSLSVYFSHTPLEKHLLIDYPASFIAMDALVSKDVLKDFKETKEIPPSVKETMEKANDIPSWKGAYPFFSAVKKVGWTQASHISFLGNVKQGQVWRLFTPCLLHYDILHILFNMAWAWILGKQIEERIGWWKSAVLILLIGSVSNVAQYLMSGPSFFGFSGAIVGMAAFIWMRQHLAPWEGYPLNRGTFLFLMLFVLGLAVLGFLTFALNMFSIIEITPMIANTAHIAGGVCGLILGRFSLFARARM